MRQFVIQNRPGPRRAPEATGQRGRLARCFVVALAAHAALAVGLGSLKLVQVWPSIAASFQLVAAPPPVAAAGDPYAAYRDFEYRPVSVAAPVGLTAHIEMPVAAPVEVIGVLGEVPIARPTLDWNWTGPTDVLAGRRGGGGGTNAAGLVAAAQPEYLQNPPPAYPWLARRNGWEGTAVLRVAVTTNGAPAQVTLLQSSGYPVLDEAATAAVRHWRFRPARLGAAPVDAQVDVPMRFWLNQPPAD